MVSSTEVDYNSIHPEFYDYLTHSKNPVRAWFHSARHNLVNELVQKHYFGGDILDVGCGTCVWNQSNLPVVGIDSNKKFLEYAFQKNRLKRFTVGKIQSSPLLKESFNLVVCSEFLEHCEDYLQIIDKFYRVLKKDGVAVITVPYDTNLSFWKPLFKLQCFLEGAIRKNPYFLAEGGHVNHFSPEKIIQSFQKAGFELVEWRNLSYFTIALVVQKK